MTTGNATLDARSTGTPPRNLRRATLTWVNLTGAAIFAGLFAALFLSAMAARAEVATLNVTPEQMDAARVILAEEQPVIRQGDKPDPRMGPITNLPLPRYVSLKGSAGNARRGPSRMHRIDWVFRHKGMPLQVIAEFGHWRRVIDQDGQGGWVHYALLSGVRTVVVTAEMADLLARPRDGSSIDARAEASATLRLGSCDETYCRVSGPGGSGWVLKTSIWGVDPDEIRE